MPLPYTNLTDAKPAPKYGLVGTADLSALASQFGPLGQMCNSSDKFFAGK